MTLLKEDPIVQATDALSILGRALSDLNAQLLTSSHAGKDKASLQTAYDVATKAYAVLREMLNQMQGAGWNTGIIEKDWFADSNSTEGYEVFKALFEDTKTNLERALNYSINVNLSGRFLQLGHNTYEAGKSATPSAPVAYGLIALVAIAVIVIVVLR